MDDWHVSGPHAPKQHPVPERSKNRDNAPLSTVTDGLGGMQVKCTHSTIYLKPTSTLCMYWRLDFLGEFTLQMQCVPCFTHLLHKQRAASLVQLRATAQERPKPAPEELPHSSKPVWENLLICSRAWGCWFPMRGTNPSLDSRHYAKFKLKP